MKTPISQLDIILISYDEDNADDNWADLLNKVPWAKRVHGVEGSDSAHKAAEKESTTDRFISVDADNIVDERFFDLEIDFDHPKFKDNVISWSAINEINGLQYGNGGLKCWPVEYVMNMRTHENAEDEKNQVDFCWEDSYVQMNNIYCKTYPNGSPKQAWRAGFREGVKMSLDQGKKVPKNKFEESIWFGNYQRLLIWASVGADVEHGLWSIYGTRLGCYMTNLTDWDFINVRDFTWLNNFWENEIAPQFIPGSADHPANLGAEHCLRTGYRWNGEILMECINDLGNTLREEMGIHVAELDVIQSKFYKKTYIGMPRTGSYVTESEINELRKLNS